MNTAIFIIWLCMIAFCGYVFCRVIYINIRLREIYNAIHLHNLKVIEDADDFSMLMYSTVVKEPHAIIPNPLLGRKPIWKDSAYLDPTDLQALEPYLQILRKD